MRKFPISTLALLGIASIASAAAITGFTNTWMNVSDLNEDGTAGNGLWGSGWDMADVPAQFDAATGVFTQQVNVNAGDNSLAGSDGDRAYWTNSSDGGVTAGASGGKHMNANVFNESWDWGGQNITWSGSTVTNDLSSAHTGMAFIKQLDPGSGWATVDYLTVELVSGQDFSLSFAPTAGMVTQAGFVIDGANGLSTQTLGGITANNLDITVSPVPEPSTYALIAGFAAFLFVAIRRRK